MCNENMISLGKADVSKLEQIQENVFLLKLLLPPQTARNAKPAAGQFYMLKRVPSSTFLFRPISVYSSTAQSDGSVLVEFLILQKGKGTNELCSVNTSTQVELFGPLGNGFASPKAGEKAAIIGGGIGVAPVAGFASNLEPKSYDFFACFKSGSYGLENVKADKLAVSTDDGSCGTKGMLPNIFGESNAKNYDVVYACGPTPMLKYVQQVCKASGTKCYLSLESRMACGMGACLGCTISTTGGNKRCCKDGPVFDGAEVIF